MSYLRHVIDYASLGYEVSLTNVFGKESILMVKRYSHPAGKALICEQIIKHSEMFEEEKCRLIFEFLYADIQEQEISGNYRERMDIKFEI